MSFLNQSQQNFVVFVCYTMDYLRMDGEQYASKVQNKALEDFHWLSQWLEWKFLVETG